MVTLVTVVNVHYYFFSTFRLNTSFKNVHLMIWFFWFLFFAQFSVITNFAYFNRSEWVIVVKHQLSKCLICTCSNISKFAIYSRILSRASTECCRVWVLAQIGWNKRLQHWYLIPYRIYAGLVSLLCKLPTCTRYTVWRVWHNY